MAPNRNFNGNFSINRHDWTQIEDHHYSRDHLIDGFKYEHIQLQLKN